jgi:DamX protein
MIQTPAQEPAADWLAALGLEQDPFAPGYRPEFFYAEAGFVQRLDLLTHLAQFSDSLLVVLGEAGAGKTTLLRELRERAGENWRVCELRGGEAHGLDAVMLRLAECLGLGALPADSGELPQRVMDHCMDLREVMELPVLIIDDAEQVPPSLLRTLAGLAGDPGATVQRLRIILFGTPPLEGLLAQAGLAPGLAPFVQTLNMPRLGEVQATAYLMYRLAVAGYVGESPFSATEVRAIAKASGGLPGSMNALAREALQAHAGQGALRRPSGRRPLRPLAIGLGTVLLLAAGAYWWAGNRPAPVVAPEPLAERPLLLPPLPATGLIAPRDLPEAEALPPAEPGPLAEPDTAAPPADRMASDEAAPPAEGPGPEGETSATEAMPAAEPIPAPGAETGQAVIPAPEAEDRAVTRAPEAEAPPAEAPVPPLVEPSAPASATTRLHDEDWIRAQPGGRHTLQLLVSRSEVSVLGFIERHGLQGDLAIYHRQPRGEDRYTLLYGVYPSNTAARAAIAGLPARVQRDKPWPRSFASVQAQLADR